MEVACALPQISTLFSTHLLMQLARPLRLLLLGAPGSGKGTQASKLLKLCPEIHTISSGDTLRAEIAKGTPLGTQAAQYIDKGELVPDKTMVELIGQELAEREWLNAQTLWLLDGFPRTAAQAEHLHKLLQKHDADLNLVVELDVDQSVILERIEARWVHSASGRVYNLDYNPPKTLFRDDLTGEALTKRSDDTAEVFQKRLDKYNDQLGPLREYYARQGILKLVLGNSSDIIFPKLKKLVEEF